MASVRGGFYLHDAKTAREYDRCNEPAPWAVGDDGLAVWLCKKHYELATTKPKG
jgi:hypothetical protein